MGVELNEVYQQDYNSQWLTQELWGQYFTETTQVPAVILSLLASFSHIQSIQILSQTLLSNFLTFTGWFDILILSFEVNQKVIYKAFSWTDLFYHSSFSLFKGTFVPVKVIKVCCWIFLLFCPFFNFLLSREHSMVI